MLGTYFRNVDNKI